MFQKEIDLKFISLLCLFLASSIYASISNELDIFFSEDLKKISPLGKYFENSQCLINKASLASEAIEKINILRDEFWKEVKVPGTKDGLNQELEKAGRVADFIELGALMCYDALSREESCGGHFREEYQTPEGEAVRNDEAVSYTHLTLPTKA